MRRRLKRILMRAASAGLAWAAPRGPRPEAAALFGHASRLLVLDLTGMGDTICLGSFLRSLFEARPDAAIDFLGSRFAPDLLGGFPFRRVHGVGGVREGARLLRGEAYDLVLVPGWVLKNTLILLLGGRHPAVGYLMDPSFGGHLHADLAVKGYGVVLAGAYPLPRGTHLTRRGDPLLRALGLAPGAPGHVLPFDGEPLPVALEAALAGAPYGVLHMGAGWSLRAWDPARFGELARRLLEEDAALRLCLVGGREDGPRGAALVGGLPPGLRGRVDDETARLTLPELGTLLRGGKFFVGNDSGPMHLADALGCRVVALMGPNLPEISGPLGPGARVLHVRMPCAPCDQRGCPESIPCMRRIDVDLVHEAVRTL